MSKLLVNKADFCTNFLGSIVNFKTKADYVPIHYLDGYLTFFAPMILEHGTVFLFCQYKPDNTDMEEGSVFYMREPQKIQKLIAMMTGERVGIGITGDQIICKTAESQFRYKLYDANLAKNNTEFVKPEKFADYKSRFKEGLELEKSDLKKIKDACNVFTEKEAYVVSKDGVVSLRVGEQERNSFTTVLGESEHFVEEFKFIKDLFLANKGGKTEICQDSDGRIIAMREELENTVKYIFTTKLR